MKFPIKKPKKSAKKKLDITGPTSAGFNSKFDKKETRIKRRISKLFNDYLDRSGIDMRWMQLRRNLLILSIVLCGLLTLSTIIAAIVMGSFVSRVILLIVLIWTVVFIALFGISVFMSLLILDWKMYKRKQQLEKVLPDFLQLTSANISAGMPIDRALWLAVRPQFGVLASEMQEIAKSNFTGDDLSESLIQFSKRYNSRMLKEAVSLIIAGIKSGGELGELLSRIAENIRETQLMQKEIAASVMTYVIFISAATVAAAPVLLALSRQMLDVITALTSSFDASQTAGVGSFSISFSESSVTLGDFTIFAMVLITVSCYFAAGIISTIRHGNTHEQFKIFPIFALISIVIFFVASYVLGLLFSGIL